MSNNYMSGLLAESEKMPQVLVIWGDGCAPCLLLKPKILDLHKQYRGFALNLLKAEGEGLEVAKELRVRAVPTVIVFSQGREITRFSGDKSAEDLYLALAKAGAIRE